MRTGIEPAKAEVKAQLPVTIRATAPCDTMGLVSRANGGIRTRVITLEE